MCKLPNRFKKKNQADKCKGPKFNTNNRTHLPVYHNWHTSYNSIHMYNIYICIQYIYITIQYNYNPTCITY